DRTIEDLTKEVDVWTATLENYIDTVIEENNETFKNKSQIKFPSHRHYSFNEQKHWQM
ncbi:10957_t:CDS:2, partial [Entrophospora sp. SA101]